PRSGGVPDAMVPEIAGVMPGRQNGRMQMPGGVQLVGWSEAVAAVERAATARRRDGAPGVVIGITGPVGAGKSALARLLSACVVTTDDYLPDYDKVEFHERDLPEKAD